LSSSVVESNGVDVSIPIYVPASQWGGGSSGIGGLAIGAGLRAWHAGIALVVEAGFVDKTFYGVIQSAFTWSDQILPMHKHNPHDEGTHFGKALALARLLAAHAVDGYMAIPGVASSATAEAKNVHAIATYIPLYQWFSHYMNDGYGKEGALKRALAAHLLLDHGVVTPTGLRLYHSVSFSTYTGAVPKWNAALEGAGVLKATAKKVTVHQFYSLGASVKVSPKKGWEDETLDDILTLYKQTMKELQE